VNTILLGISLLVLSWSCAGLASAATEGNWARNSEADLSGYNVYACFTVGCTVTKTAAMKQSPAITQTAVGLRPRWILPTGQDGVFAVTAFDTSANESGLSVSVPFSTTAPAIPSDVRTQ
jgi:hypothetical protein